MWSLLQVAREYRRRLQRQGTQSPAGLLPKLARVRHGVQLLLGATDSRRQRTMHFEHGLEQLRVRVDHQNLAVEKETSRPGLEPPKTRPAPSLVSFLRGGT